MRVNLIILICLPIFILALLYRFFWMLYDHKKIKRPRLLKHKRFFRFGKSAILLATITGVLNILVAVLPVKIEPNYTLPAFSPSHTSFTIDEVPLAVNLSAPSGYEICFTTDDTDPQENGIKYDNSISISKSTIIRARYKIDNYTWSEQNISEYLLIEPEEVMLSFTGASQYQYKTPDRLFIYYDNEYISCLNAVDDIVFSCSNPNDFDILIQRIYVKVIERFEAKNEIFVTRGGGGVEEIRKYNSNLGKDLGDYEAEFTLVDRVVYVEGKGIEAFQINLSVPDSEVYCCEVFVEYSFPSKPDRIITASAAGPLFLIDYDKYLDSEVVWEDGFYIELGFAGLYKSIVGQSLKNNNVPHYEELLEVMDRYYNWDGAVQ